MPVFFLIVTVVVVTLHAYIGLRLIPHNRKWLWGVVGASALSIPLAFVAGRALGQGAVTTFMAWYGFGSLGLMGIFAALVFFRDLFLVTARLAPRGTDPARRAFLKQVSAIGVLGAGAVIATEGLINAHRPPKLERVRVPIDNLPAGLQGFRIVQISDTHVGPTLGRDFLQDVVDRTNGQEPDLIAMTGDLADGYVHDMEPIVEPLRGLRATHGTFFVTGNHEYYWQPRQWIAKAEELGMTVLLNAHKLLDVNGSKLAVGGVPDIREGAANGGYAPERTFAGAGDADFKLLLAHQPKSLYDAQRAGAQLQLCGHTHGGQVFPMNLLVHLIHPIVSGLGRFGDTWVYVNRGTAYWGPPMRTGGAGEITLIELVNATA